MSGAIERLYISGPMTGLPELNFPAFAAAAAGLRAIGYEVVNPAEICVNQNGDWQACMRADIKAMCDCNAIVLLPGWQNSQGANLELHIAHRLGLAVHFLHDLAPNLMPNLMPEEHAAGA